MSHLNIKLFCPEGSMIAWWTMPISNLSDYGVNDYFTSHPNTKPFHSVIALRAIPLSNSFIPGNPWLLDEPFQYQTLSCRGILDCLTIHPDVKLFHTKPGFRDCLTNHPNIKLFRLWSPWLLDKSLIAWQIIDCFWWAIPLSNSFMPRNLWLLDEPPMSHSDIKLFHTKESVITWQAIPISNILARCVNLTWRETYNGAHSCFSFMLGLNLYHIANGNSSCWLHMNLGTIQAWCVPWQVVLGINSIAH